MDGKRKRKRSAYWIQAAQLAETYRQQFAVPISYRRSTKFCWSRSERQGIGRSCFQECSGQLHQPKQHAVKPSELSHKPLDCFFKESSSGVEDKKKESYEVIDLISDESEDEEPNKKCNSSKNSPSVSDVKTKQEKFQKNYSSAKDQLDEKVHKTKKNDLYNEIQSNNLLQSNSFFLKGLKVIPTNVLKLIELWYRKHRICIVNNVRLVCAKDFAKISRTKWKEVVLMGTIVFQLNRWGVSSYYLRNKLPFQLRNSKMYWCCISRDFVELIPLVNTLKIREMKKIFEDILLPLFQIHSGLNFIQVPDYYNKIFNSTNIKKILNENSIEIYEWPKWIEDLNPMEHLWEVLESKLASGDCVDVKDMTQKVEDIWRNDSDIASLYNEFTEAMPHIMETLIEKNGASF